MSNKKRESLCDITEKRKDKWGVIYKEKERGADLVQKARLQTLRSELETLKIKPNEKVSDYGGKLSSIKAKFKGLGKTLEDKILVRKLLNSAPKKFLPIVATIEQYQDLDEMKFEEAVGRLTAYEEQIKSQDTLEGNDQDKFLMASSNNKSNGKWRGKDLNRESNGKWRGKDLNRESNGKWRGKDLNRESNGKWRGKDLNRESNGKWRGKDLNRESNGKWRNTNQGSMDKNKITCYECGEPGHFMKKMHEMEIQ
nr:zinc finger, CCHC-type [Tanacetum cinerariifolium]